MADLLLAYRYSPHTTANYLADALEALGHTVRCAGPGHDGGMDAGCDAFIWVEAGGGFPDWLPDPTRRGVPTAAWFIDSHSQLRWHIELAQAFEQVFVAQRAALSWFERAVHWLPCACDPQVHTPPAGIEPVHDVVFVGHLYEGSPLYERRRRMLRALAERYNVGVYQGVYGRHLAPVHAKGRVVVNVSALGDLNMRVFEALCSGRPLVTDAIPGAGLEELFVPGVELVTYSDPVEAFGQIDRLLAHPDEARLMADAGRRAVMAAHTYLHRAKQICEEMGL